MPESKPISLISKIGLAVLALSMALWAFLPIIPFLPLSGGKKAIFASIDFIAAEVTFYGGLALAGKAIVSQITSRLPWKRKQGPAE